MDAASKDSRLQPRRDGGVPCSAWLGGKRRELCNSLVKSGARTVRDGQDHSEKVNRCIVEGGKCVGYYAMLIHYEESTDTFCIGRQQRIPAAWVDEVVLFDAISTIIQLLENLVRSLPPNDPDQRPGAKTQD